MCILFLCILYSFSMHCFCLAYACCLHSVCMFGFGPGTFNMQTCVYHNQTDETGAFLHRVNMLSTFSRPETHKCNCTHFLISRHGHFTSFVCTLFAYCIRFVCKLYAFCMHFRIWPRHLRKGNHLGMRKTMRAFSASGEHDSAARDRKMQATQGMRILYPNCIYFVRLLYACLSLVCIHVVCMFSCIVCLDVSGIITCIQMQERCIA